MAKTIAERRSRLKTLENTIKRNYEKFVETGFALKEIREDRLWEEHKKEDGSNRYKDWTDYLARRVGQEFGIEKTQAQMLITCSEIRPKLPDVSSSGGPEEDGWTQVAIYEFRRLAPVSEDHGQRYDFRKLKKSDVNRVASKVLDYCDAEEKSITSTIVKDFVDQDLGVGKYADDYDDEEEVDEEPKIIEEDTDDPMYLPNYLRSRIGIVEGITENLMKVPGESWRLLEEKTSHAKLVRRLAEACETLAAMLRSDD